MSYTGSYAFSYARLQTGTYYGMVISVRLGLRPFSVPPSGSPSASFQHFSPTCFDILSRIFLCVSVLWTLDQVWVSSISVNFCKSLTYSFFWNLEYCKHTVLRIFLLHALSYWAELLQMTLSYCTSDQARVSSICVNGFRFQKLKMLTRKYQNKLKPKGMV